MEEWAAGMEGIGRQEHSRDEPGNKAWGQETVCTMRKEPSSREESVGQTARGSLERNKRGTLPVRALMKCTKYWKLVKHWDLCLTIWETGEPKTRGPARLVRPSRGHTL